MTVTACFNMCGMIHIPLLEIKCDIEIWFVLHLNEERFSFLFLCAKLCYGITVKYFNLFIYKISINRKKVKAKNKYL